MYYSLAGSWLYPAPPKLWSHVAPPGTWHGLAAESLSGCWHRCTVGEQQCCYPHCCLGTDQTWEPGTCLTSKRIFDVMCACHELACGSSGGDLTRAHTMPCTGPPSMLLSYNGMSTAQASAVQEGQRYPWKLALLSSPLSQMSRIQACLPNSHSSTQRWV
jgi:hypothetical protein